METIVGLIGGFVLAIPLTVAGSYYLFVLQRARKELGWEVISSTPIVTRPTGRPDIQVIVSPRLLGEAEKDDNSGWSGIQEFRAFRVRARNTGNQVLESLSIRFALEEGARAVSLEPEVEPLFGEQAIRPELQTPDVRSARAMVPFLNPREEVIFSLQAINSPTGRCEVSVGAPGLVFYNLYEHRLLREALLWLAGLMVIGGAVAAILLLNWQEGLDISREEDKPDSTLTVWGWLAFFSGLAGLWCLGRSISPALRRRRFRRRHAAAPAGAPASS